MADQPMIAPALKDPAILDRPKSVYVHALAPLLGVASAMNKILFFHDPLEFKRLFSYELELEVFSYIL